MSLERAGYVGLFQEPLDRERIAGVVRSWIDRFGAIEQTAGNGPHALTLPVRNVSDIVWQRDLQFRILSGGQFAWIYMTMDRRVVETSGLAPKSGASLCRDVLDGAPGCGEIIDERNEARLDQLEKLGVM